MTSDHPEPVPDTGMATGNDEGEPGERFRGGPLDPEEQAVLEDLRDAAGEDGAATRS